MSRSAGKSAKVALSSVEMMNCIENVKNVYSEMIVQKPLRQKLVMILCIFF
jgi:hypothetical protein